MKLIPTLILFFVSSLVFGQNKKPNIVLIMADDLGYGDVGYLNPDAKTKTPHLDALAKAGMSFTNAHSPSAVCTPTRYALLTGHYSWRSAMKKGVLHGYSPPLIEVGRETIATMLQKQGYQTACVGKWHLGLDWQPKMAGEKVDKGGVYPDGSNVDFGKTALGPKLAGFDYSYIIPASLDMEPYCFVRNGQVLGLPMQPYAGEPALTEGRHINRFHRGGVIAQDFTIENTLPTFVNEAEGFIQKNKDKPFFLYLPLNSPHTPWVPVAPFKGSSQVGLYGDFVAQTDAAVGRLVALLDSLNLSKNTLIVFTSDNGAYWRQPEIDQFDHRANADWRGMKADIYEGGHREPFFVKWPGQIKPGSLTDQALCLTDIFASVASIVDASLSKNTAEDSFNFWPVWSGKNNKKVRESIIHQSGDGMLALREGDWKYVEALGSGGFTEPKRAEAKTGEPNGQLYNLKNDPAETDDLVGKDAARAKALAAKLEKIRNQGFSR